MHSTTPPTLAELGRDLLDVPLWRLILSLVAPFALALAFFGFAFLGWWLPALTCTVLLSFVTYGSISHDLVHGSLGLPRRLNDLLLTLVELLLLRSGRAYRLAHLNHHARYPDLEEDPEARAAHGTFWTALRSGPVFFIRLWWWAVLKYPRHRARLVTEGTAVLALMVGAVVVAAVGWSVAPLIYVLLAYLGTWIVPLFTAYVPHTPEGKTRLSQTRRFRGWVARLLALDHLYHLEHHLYPAVPHHLWPKLANRLDHFLDEAGVPVVRLGMSSRGDHA